MKVQDLWHCENKQKPNSWLVVGIIILSLLSTEQEQEANLWLAGNVQAVKIQERLRKGLQFENDQVIV